MRIICKICKIFCDATVFTQPTQQTEPFNTHLIIFTHRQVFFARFCKFSLVMFKDSSFRCEYLIIERKINKQTMIVVQRFLTKVLSTARCCRKVDTNRNYVIFSWYCDARWLWMNASRKLQSCSPFAVAPSSAHHRLSCALFLCHSAALCCPGPTEPKHTLPLCDAWANIERGVGLCDSEFMLWRQRNKDRRKPTLECVCWRFKRESN